MVPPEKALRRLYAEQNGMESEESVKSKEFGEICRDPKVKAALINTEQNKVRMMVKVIEAVLKEMQQMGKAQKLNSIEQV